MTKKKTAKVAAVDSPVTAVATRPQSGRATVAALFEKSSSELTKALAGQMGTDRFIRAAMTAYANGGTYFQSAHPVSLLGACMQAAQLGLSVDPVLGEAWLIPRRNSARDCVWISFQLGYKGLLKLARRNQNFLSAHAEIVHEGDFFQYDLGSSPHVTHRKQLDITERPTMLCTYAIVRYREGAAQVHVSPLFEIHEARDRSDSFQNGRGPWIDFFQSMAKIVPLRAILKLEAIDDVILRQLGREDAQEGATDVIEYGADGELSITSEELPPAELGPPSSVDAIKAQFGGTKPEVREVATHGPRSDIPDEPA